MASEKRKKRLVFSWTRTKGLAAILLFIALASILEYAIVLIFSSNGLRDQTQIVVSSVSISVMFHLVPLSVIVALLTSYIYITRHIATIEPETMILPKKSSKKRSDLQRTSLSMKKSFRRFSQAIKLDTLSSFWNRSHFGKAVVKGSIAVSLLFILVVLIIWVAVNPITLYEFVSQLYQNNSSFHDLILGTSRTISSLNNSLGATAASFARALSDALTPFGTAIVNLDTLAKYLICQNAAAWVTALLVVLYGYYRERS